MNNSVYVDADITDDVRRQRLYEGQLFVYSPRASSRAFIEFARELIKKPSLHMIQKQLNFTCQSNGTRRFSER